MASNGAAGSDVLTIYWLPGCSSCLRMKEFVGGLGVPFESVNCSLHPEAAERPLGLGVKVPAAVRGDRAISGTDLAGIAALVDLEFTASVALAPEQLAQRYDQVIGIAIELIELVPDDGFDAELAYDEPGRVRTLRQLVAHLATIMRGFVAAEDTNVFTNGMEFIPTGGERTATRSELLDLATGSRDALRTWWKEVGHDDPFDRILESDQTRVWTLLEALERAVWHTTHHVRQFQGFLASQWDLAPHTALTDELLAGLPMPKAVYA